MIFLFDLFRWSFSFFLYVLVLFDHLFSDDVLIFSLFVIISFTDDVDVFEYQINYHDEDACSSYFTEDILNIEDV